MQRQNPVKGERGLSPNLPLNANMSWHGWHGVEWVMGSMWCPELGCATGHVCSWPHSDLGLCEALCWIELQRGLHGPCYREPHTLQLMFPPSVSQFKFSDFTVEPRGHEK